MPQTIYMPSSPWEQFLPQTLANLILAKTHDVYATKAAEREKRYQLEKEGYKEAEAQIPDVTTPGGKAYVAPESKIMFRQLEGGYGIPYIQRGKQISPIGIIKPQQANISWQKKTKRYLKDNIAMGQDYIFNPKTMQEVNIGDPYKLPPGQKIDVNIDMTKKTQADLEEDILSGYEVLDMLERVNKLYDPRFLEYLGKGQTYFENVLSKMGLSEAEFASKRATWALEVDRYNLAYRKLITGVAGGPVEMKDIEKTVINTKYDSPAQYEAKRDYMPIIAEAAINRAQYLLNKGFKNPYEAPLSAKKEAARKFPYPKFGKTKIKKALTPEQEAEEYLRKKGQ